MFMHYVVTKNQLGEIINCWKASPVRLIADAVALNESDKYHTVELWVGNDFGPIGSYAVTKFINGTRLPL